MIPCYNKIYTSKVIKNTNNKKKRSDENNAYTRDLMGNMSENDYDKLLNVSKIKTKNIYTPTNNNYC